MKRFNEYYGKIILGLCRLHNERATTVSHLAYMYKDCFTKKQISSICFPSAQLDTNFWREIVVAIKDIDIEPLNPSERRLLSILNDVGDDIAVLIIFHLHKPVSALSALFRYIPSSENKDILKMFNSLPSDLQYRARSYIKKLNKLFLDNKNSTSEFAFANAENVALRK